ncbi:ATP-binding protein [Variovorax sp. JS1663]|uniref:ATP-binding protein n=1 Tax=Variovorax sp. JS1663 TaxID=1851577 RepID=UPI000B342B53|nr:winged helix-turn-helix domain-containing protein [Variovorax sp. JS1663]OUL99457.1 hypothetical protein A8M77_26070 [Variovorax sp. JS1663]
MPNDFVDRTHCSYIFGPFELLPGRQLLLRDGVQVRIGGRAIDILLMLLERSGQLVSKQELMERVWHKTVVEEGNLKVNIANLRRVLGDGPGPCRYIATVNGRGYRFIAGVQTGDEMGHSAPLAEPSGPGHNFPIARTKIFGRREAINAIQHDLGVTRLVSIVGAGGIGKTTVALAAAEQAASGFRDGAWWIDLTLVNSPALIPNALAATMRLTVHTADVLGALCEALHGRHVLLVLDNCDQMINATAECVERILATTVCPRILVTSREPLRVSGERVRRLPGLGTPFESSHLRATEALTFPAVQLFVDRAAETLDRFKLRDADVPAIAEICRRLDGVALAIELAATRIEAFGVAGILKQLEDGSRLLGSRRAGPKRHRTLTATLDWSYGLLSEDEATLLRAVSAFPACFDSVSASAVAAIAVPDASEGLAQLASKSLLATELDGEDVLYRMLETTRDYCAGLLRSSGVEDEVRSRHAQHVLELLRCAARERGERPAIEWGATYKQFIDDLRSALAWAGQDQDRADLQIELTVAGIVLWEHLSLMEECRQHVVRAIGQLDATQFAGAAFEMQLQASLAGTTMFLQGCVPQVEKALQRALEIADRIGHIDFRLRCLRMLAAYHLFGGKNEETIQTIETRYRCHGG